jgi:hypothetical protein
MVKLEDKVIEKMQGSIEKILKEGVNTNNLDNLYKLSKIKHMAKEDKNMNYDRCYDNYGRYDSYGKRGYDMKYRGHDHLDRMYDDYGRYMESRSRYGVSEETDKSFHYMVKALEDFIRVLYEEADTPQQKQQLRDTLQRSMM